MVSKLWRVFNKNKTKSREIVAPNKRTADGTAKYLYGPGATSRYLTSH